MASDEHKETVTISIRWATDSPLFVGGTWTDPKWKPFKLTPRLVEPELGPDEEEESGSPKAKTEYIHSRDFELLPGEYKYKFTSGEGKPWFASDVLDRGMSISTLSLCLAGFCTRSN